MRTLSVPLPGKRMSNVLNLILIATVVLTIVTLAVTVTPVAAGTSCGPWSDAGYCCREGWPEWERDVRKRTCTYCNYQGQCNSWTEYKCSYWSTCEY